MEKQTFKRVCSVSADPFTGGEEDVALIAGSAPRLTKSLIVFERRDITLLNVSRARFIT